MSVVDFSQPCLAIFFDGDETPTIRMARTDQTRPARGDVSWRVEDEATGRVVEEYHPRRSSLPSRTTHPFPVRS